MRAPAGISIAPRAIPWPARNTFSPGATGPTALPSSQSASGSTASQPCGSGSPGQRRNPAPSGSGSAVLASAIAALCTACPAISARSRSGTARGACTGSASTMPQAAAAARCSTGSNGAWAAMASASAREISMRDDCHHRHALRQHAFTRRADVLTVWHAAATLPAMGRNATRPSGHRHCQHR